MTDPTQDARAAFDRYGDAIRTNFFQEDPHLRALLKAYGRGDAAEPLEAFGALCAEPMDALARETNRDEHLPKLRRYDGFGRREERVDFHPGYHDLGRMLYAAKPMSRYREPGHEFETLCIQYLYAQNGEAGHACPMACTAGLIKILQGSPGKAPAEWLERLLDPDYDTHFHGAQWLTEVQGGSDVGANSLVARPQEGGTHRLYGEKWFCSVIDAQLILVTARPEGSPGGTRGVMAYVMPRTLPEGGPNHFTVRRLKYKLGTRSMASAEVDFDGAVAWPMVDFKETVDVVLNTSRLYNAVCSAAALQRAAREARIYASERVAFGQPILAFPTVARIVADLSAEAYGARGLTFFLMDLSDRLSRGEGGEREKMAFRFWVNLNKFWTSQVATRSLLRAIEVLGGNGAIESFSVLPRLLRDSVVCEAWEGGHNVLCTQAFKDSLRLGLHEAAFEVLAEASAAPESLEGPRRAWAQLLELPQGRALTHVRDVAEAMRAGVQAAALKVGPTALAQWDPRISVAAEHLQRILARGYDPLADEGLMTRVAALIQGP